MLNNFPKKLLNGDVIIKPLKFESETKTESGLYIPSSSDHEHLRKGIIMCKDHDHDKVKTEIGDLVVFSTHAGEEIKIKGKLYYRMREQGNVIMILDKETEDFEE